MPTPETENTFRSTFFPTEDIEINGFRETIVRGGRDLFPEVELALGNAGIENILSMGWGVQGRAQSQNWRDTLAAVRSTRNVRVGLRPNSDSIAEAESFGFSRADGTLGMMYDMIPDADLVIALIQDGAMAQNWRKIQDLMRPGTTLAVSHAFIAGYLKSQKEVLRDDINFVLMAPKGLGDAVRWNYVEARKGVEGAGVNASIAVEQDVTGRAIEIPLAWAIAGGGAPTIFRTTFEKEYLSDIFGERAILLGGVYGMVEVLYRHFLSQDHSDASDIEKKKAAYRNSVEVVTGPLSTAISEIGLKGVAESFYGEERAAFNKAYAAAYDPMREVMERIYREVKSGREIDKVAQITLETDVKKMPKIGETEMWSEIGPLVQEERNSGRFVQTDIHPVTAGIYIAGMVAQADILRENGHFPSEIGNETIIEAVNSLNLVMHDKGVAGMVDGCSVTARLGAREWGPQFDHRLMQNTLPRLTLGLSDREGEILQAFGVNPVHAVLRATAALRPAGSLIVPRH